MRSDSGDQRLSGDLKEQWPCHFSQKFLSDYCWKIESSDYRDQWGSRKSCQND